MTIRAKILLGFITVFIIGLILGITGFVSTNLLTGMSDELYYLQNQSNSISNILNAHFTWRQGLTESILTNTEFTGSLDPNNCALGKWKNSGEINNIDDPGILSLLEQVDEPHTYIHTEAAKINDLIKQNNMVQARRMLVNEVLPRTETTIKLLTSTLERVDALTSEMSDKIIRTGDIARVIIIILLAFALLSSAFLSLKILGSVMKPLKAITKAAGAIALGDLDVKIDYNIKDQIGELTKSFRSIIKSTEEQLKVAQALASGDLTVEVKIRSEKDTMNIAFNKMIENLNDMFNQINTATVQVSSGSRQISDGAQSLAQGATEQTAVVEELSASIGDITQKTNRNATIAKEAADLSNGIKKNAQTGSTQMEQMMNAVSDINNASGQIEKVIKVIDDIAFQTNILALNAAVEAARAGQHGKGFAVVAEEVRGLAAKSAEAASGTGELIKNSIEKANFGLNIATETSKSLNQIVEGINRSADIVSQIALSSDEQANAIIQINTGIEQVVQVVQQTSATAEQSAAAGQEMSAQAAMLEELVDKFKLKNSY